MGLSGEIEIILTNSQARLLKKFNQSMVDATPGLSSNFIYLLFHIRVLVTYPRLFWLGEYYDPEELDLAGFEMVDKHHVRLIFYNCPS